MPLRHTRGNLTQKRQFSYVTFRSFMGATSTLDAVWEAPSQVEASFAILKSLSSHGMKITLTEQHVVLAPHLDPGSILRSNSTRSCGLTVLTLVPTATTSPQASRRPIATVAGIKIPPLLRRSPGSLSVEHPVMQQPDRQRTFVQAAGVFAAA